MAKTPNRYVDQPRRQLLAFSCPRTDHPFGRSLGTVDDPCSAVRPSELNLLESVEAMHANLAFNNRIAELLSITRAPARMDSQAKYGCLARGDGGVYFWMATGTGYKEKIWVSWTPVLVFYMLNGSQDHASGTLLVEECGGRITDSRGQPLDFGLGRSLGENYGLIAAHKDVHGQILAAVQQALAETGGK